MNMVCGLKSGALITTRYAAEQGRRVYAVPGNVGAPGSVGPNRLIRDGAKLVTRCEDIIEDFADEFDLKQLDRIITSEKYLRYEYNHSIPVGRENKPIADEAKEPIKIAAAQTKKPSASGRPTRVRRTEPVKREAAKSIARDDFEKEPDIGKREQILLMLDDNQKRVLDALPDGEAVTTDRLTSTGLSTNMILSSLTMLELFSAVESLPGGLYRKLI